MTRQTTERENAIREEIRKSLRGGLAPLEIARSLGLSKSAVYRHLQVIREEESQLLRELIRDDLAITFRIAVDCLDDRIRDLMKIVEQETTDVRAKIRAIRLMADLELKSINLIAGGDALWRYKLTT